LKGATDGGIYVPHSVNNFPGHSKGDGDDEAKYDPAVHRDRIFGKHIDTYYNSLKKDSAAL